MNIDTMRTRLALLEKKAALTLDAATRDARNLTDAERADLSAVEKEIESLASRIERADSDDAMRGELDRITGGAGTGTRGNQAGVPTRDGLPPRTESWGRTFTSAAAITQFLKAGLPSAGQWSSPSVDLRATAVLESTSPIVQPQFLPSIVPGPTPPLVVAQLFAGGTATSGIVSYTVETAATNAADVVSEGAAKPESGLVFALKNEPLHKIATWLPASNELLDDVPQMMSYIDARLQLFVRLKLDDELLNGSGVAPHMLGMLTRTDLTPAVAATGNGIDAIAKQIAAVETASGLAVDGICLNPVDWLSLGLVKTTTNEYIAGSPFEQAGPSTLFGRNVAVTPKIAQGTALVGAFKTGAQLFLHPNMRTAISNSHENYFVLNLLAILSEIRAALAVFRPVAFGKVTGLPAPIV